MKKIYILFLLTILFSCNSKVKILDITDNELLDEVLNPPTNISYLTTSFNDPTTIPLLTFDNEGSSVDYCLGTTNSSCDVMGWSNTPINSINDTGLSLVDGKYYLQIKSIKGNLESSIVIIELLLDTTPPGLVTVLTLDNHLTASLTTTPNISFTNPSDSDFNKTQYCIGTSSTNCNIKALSDTPSNNFNVSSLSLSDGTYFINIQSIDNIGNTSSFASESWTVDNSNPNPITALSAPDTASFSDTGTITFTASSSGDVNRYEYSLGTSSGDTDVQDWTSIGTNTSFTASGLSLSANTYYVNVRTVDNVGNLSPVVTDSWVASLPSRVGASYLINSIGSYNRSIYLSDAVSYDGKIYVLGYIFYNGFEGSGAIQGGTIFVKRLNSDLSIDTTFGTNGYRLIPGELGASAQHDFSRDIKIDNDVIWVSGLFASNNGTEDYQWGIASLDIDGNMNTSWSGDGVFIYNDSAGLPLGSFGSHGQYYEMELLPLSSGIAMVFSTESGEPIIYALNSDSSLNTSFYSDGIAEASEVFGSNGDDFNGIKSGEIASDGSLIFNGQDASGYAYFAKLRTNLTADTSYNTTGSLVSSSFWYNGSTGHLNLDASDRAWLFIDGPADGIIQRVSSSGVEDSSFGGGDRWKYVWGSNAYYGGVVTSNHLYAVGWDNDSYISRLSLTGSVDSTFETSGYYEEGDSGLNWGSFKRFIKISDTQAMWMGQRGSSTKKPMLVLFNLH